MQTTRRDAAYRSQPDLFSPPPDPPPRPSSLPVDHGRISRDETHRCVAPTFKASAAVWLGRIVAAGPAGITLDELSELYGTPPNAFSGRITELAKDRKVVRTSARRQTRSGQTAAVIVAAQYIATTTNPRPQS